MTRTQVVVSLVRIAVLFISIVFFSVRNVVYYLFYQKNTTMYYNKITIVWKLRFVLTSYILLKFHASLKLSDKFWHFHFLENILKSINSTQNIYIYFNVQIHL